MNKKLFVKIFKDISKYIIGTDEYSYIKDDKMYPIDLAFTLKNIQYFYEPFDTQGIPCVEYGSVGIQYNPTRIASFGFSNFNDFILTKSEVSKENFSSMLNWFFNNEKARYYYNFNLNNLKAPWISCMAQGEAASILIRGYYLTNNEKYLVKAKQALEPFFISIKNGGVSSLIDNKLLFLEEYPEEFPEHVLNGFLYSLIGLIEYYKVTKDEEYIKLINTLMNTLEKKIEFWGASTWSYYQVPLYGKSNNCCTPGYHNLHISQLKYVVDYKKSEILNDKIKKWEKGKKSFTIRISAMVCKITHRYYNKTQR
jgi:hypothetical protein